MGSNCLVLAMGIVLAGMLWLRLIRMNRKLLVATDIFPELSPMPIIGGFVQPSHEPAK